jgi:hypothetical protein
MQQRIDQLNQGKDDLQQCRYVRHGGSFLVSPDCADISKPKTGWNMSHCLTEDGMATSIGNMIKRIAGLQGTRDVNEWEDGFIGSMVDRTEGGKEATGLSAKQIENIERIFNKHFAG